jgi:hypothetical protein
MPSPALDFDALADLSTYLSGLRQGHVPTMNHYATADGKGFWHHPAIPKEASLSSTATCVASLVHAGLLDDDEKTWGSSRQLVARLVKRPWESAGLAVNNPFSLSFLAQGVLDICGADAFSGSEGYVKLVNEEIAPLLIKEIERHKPPLFAAGSVNIAPYPPSAYLTQLAFRNLRRCGAVREIDRKRVRAKVRLWSRGEISRQMSLISTRNRLADPLQLAYAVITFADASQDEQRTPEEKTLIREALSTFFDTQLGDGTWQSSQPIFHYPDVGNAQCYDFELLSELLRCVPLQDELIQYFPKLQKAAASLQHSGFDLGGPATGWASGHHPQLPGPESWSTACVYDFIYSLDRLVAEGIRRSLFGELRAVYTPPVRAMRDGSGFAEGFLDAEVAINGDTDSLLRVLLNHFVEPIYRQRDAVSRGGRLGRSTPMSAILFGPPGTSKTKLAQLIGRHLGWPVLTVDPSYLVQDGLENIYARSNRLFSMLSMAEEVVVLLDEFDELGRDRASEQEPQSRFITTSMLPKLAAINEQRKIVFLLATNYLSRFDQAFSRGGRFDMILQIMPPTAEAKLRHAEWGPSLDAAIESMTGTARAEAVTWLSGLTFLETEQLVFRLRAGVDDAYKEFRTAHQFSTLEREDGKWKKQAEEERKDIRIPAIDTAPANVK